MFIDNSNVILDFIFMKAGDGKDSDTNKGGDGGHGIIISNNVENSLILNNGSVEGGCGGFGLGEEEGLGGYGIKTGKFLSAGESVINGINGEKGSGNGGNGIVVPNISILKKIQVNDAIIKGGDSKNKKVDESGKKILFGTSLPSKYCSAYDENLVTSIKDQHLTQLCWCFSLNAIAETDMLYNYPDYASKLKGSNHELDFSEKKVAYYVGRPKAEPLEGTNKYYTVEYYDRDYSTGRDLDPTISTEKEKMYDNIYDLMTNDPRVVMDTLITGNSIVAENKDASLNSKDFVGDGRLSGTTIPTFASPDIDLIEGETYDYSTTGSGMLNISQINSIKNLVKENKAVLLGVNVEPNCLDKIESGTYDWDGTTVKYSSWNRLQSSVGGSGHAVTIIGWDDNFPKENFLDSVRPSTDGAWIIKNSWGGDSYHFVSYEYNTQGQFSVTVYKFIPKDGSYDYSYSYGHMITFLGLIPLLAPLEQNDILKNKYTIRNDREIIKSVLLQSFADGQVNLNIKKNGSSIYSKNYTIKQGVANLELDKFIMAKKDDTILVEIKSISPSFLTVPIMEDKSEFVFMDAFTSYLKYNLNVSADVSTYKSATGVEKSMKDILKDDYGFPTPSEAVICGIKLLTEEVPTNYTIKFDANGGVGTKIQTYSKMDRRAILGNMNLDKEYYKLVGFDTDKNANKNNFKYEITANRYDTVKDIYMNIENSTGYDDSGVITLYAIWEDDGNQHSNSGSTSSSSGGDGAGGVGPISNIKIPKQSDAIKINQRSTSDMTILAANAIWQYNPIDSTWSLHKNANNSSLFMQNEFVNIVTFDLNTNQNRIDIFCFDNNCKMITGWAKDDVGSMYYFETQKNENEGKMIVGWKEIGEGNWYYFGIDGKLLINTVTPDGYFVDINGLYKM